MRELLIAWLTENIGPVKSHTSLAAVLATWSTGFVTAQFLGMIIRTTDPRHRWVASQRIRYAANVFGMIGSVTLYGLYMYLTSPAHVFSVSREWMDVGGPYAWIVALTPHVVWVSPALFIIGTFVIYFRPAVVARRCWLRKGWPYLLTDDVRKGDKSSPVRIERYRGAFGPTSTFRYI